MFCFFLALLEYFYFSDFKRRISLEAFPEWNVVALEWYRLWAQALTCNLKVPPINNSAIIASKAKNDWTNKVSHFFAFVA